MMERRHDESHDHEGPPGVAPLSDEELMDETSEASFPASDPPGYVPLHVGVPADPPHPDGHLRR